MGEPRIPEEMVSEVFTLASRLYAEKNQEYSLAELTEAGAEANIPPEFIQQALQEIQAQKIAARKRQENLRIILISLGAVIGVWGIWTYNTLSSTSQRVEGAWAQVENQFQRRADLIPNLVNVTQAYARQEREIINQLTQSRQAYQQADNPNEKITAMTQVSQAIGNFQTSIASKPQLQSSQAFTNLQYELAGTENRIAVERRRYNQAVQIYNQKVQAFPNSIVATLFGFKPKAFFQAENSQLPVINPEKLK